MQDSGLHGFCFEDKSTPSRTEHARCKRCLPRMNVKWRREGSKPLSARGLRLYALKKKRKCAADSFAQTVWPGKVHSPASDHSRIESLHELREMRHRKRLCDFTALLAFGEDFPQQAYRNFFGPPHFRGAHGIHRSGKHHGSPQRPVRFHFAGHALIHSPQPLRRCDIRSEEHTSELQSRLHLVCRLLLEKKKTQ